MDSDISATASTDNRSSLVRVLLIDFDHSQGPIVERSFPAVAEEDDTNDASPARVALPPAWKHLPFYCLPDGAHNTDAGVVFFSLPAAHGGATVFCVAAHRQMPSTELRVRPAHVSRATVHKSICVILQRPLTGLIKEQVEKAANDLFAQRDFTNLDVLEQLLVDVSQRLNHEEVTAADFNVGWTPSRLVLRFRHQALTLFKLLMLQKRVLAVGSNAGDVSGGLMTLASLFPSVLGGDPTVEPDSIDARLGIPLSLFGEEGEGELGLTVFRPYLPLQDTDTVMEKTKKKTKKQSFLVGSTNQLVLREGKTRADVVVDFDRDTLTVVDREGKGMEEEEERGEGGKGLARLDTMLSLTVADRRFMGSVLHGIETEESELSSESGGEREAKNDAFVRRMFRIYQSRFLAVAMGVREAARVVRAREEQGQSKTMEGERKTGVVAAAAAGGEERSVRSAAELMDRLAGQRKTREKPGNTEEREDLSWDVHDEELVDAEEDREENERDARTLVREEIDHKREVDDDEDDNNNDADEEKEETMETNVGAESREGASLARLCGSLVSARSQLRDFNMEFHREWIQLEVYRRWKARYDAKVLLLPPQQKVRRQQEGQEEEEEEEESVAEQDDLRALLRLGHPNAGALNMRDLRLRMEQDVEPVIEKAIDTLFNGIDAVVANVTDSSTPAGKIVQSGWGAFTRFTSYLQTDATIQRMIGMGAKPEETETNE